MGFGLHTIAHLAGDVASPVANGLGAVTGANSLTDLGHNIGSNTSTLSNPGGLFSNNNQAFTGSNTSYSGGGTPATQHPGGTAAPGGVQQDASGNYDASGTAGSGGAGGANAQGYTPLDLSSLDSQATDLNSLLGRTQTGLDQGLQGLSDSYNSNVTDQTNQHNQANQNYADNRVATNKDKLGAYDTINKNAGNGYRSLAQIIGRSAGTGSSAFQDLLPNVVGRDTSSQRQGANDTYASNLGNIDTAQKKTDQSFADILNNLQNQRQAQEQQLRTGVETQRQGIEGQLGQNAATRAAALGGDANAVAAAQAPYQGQIDNSRNAVESFFNQFKPTLTAAQAPIAAPDLAAYKTDRSVVNAQQQGSPDPSNPYSDILRKKLQEGV